VGGVDGGSVEVGPSRRSMRPIWLDAQHQLGPAVLARFGSTLPGWIGFGGAGQGR